MAELPAIQQAVVGWSPRSNGLGVLGTSPDWPLVEGRPWLPEPARTFLPRGSDAAVVNGAEPPCGLRAHPTPYGTLLVSSVYLGRVGRPGTFTAHCLLDPADRLGGRDLLDLVRGGVLRRDEVAPEAGPLPVLLRGALRPAGGAGDPRPQDLPADLLALLLGHLATDTPLLLRCADRITGPETLVALARALPRPVAAGMWWSTFVAHPYDAGETAGAGVGLVVPPFSVTDEFGEAGARDREPVDLDRDLPDASTLAHGLAHSYLARPDLYADAADPAEFIARLQALSLDPADPVDDRVLDLLADEVGPVVFARLVTGDHAMARLAEIVRADRRLPYGALWNEVRHLPDEVYAWFAPTGEQSATQQRAQHTICTTMDMRALTRLLARPLSRDVAAYRPVIADRRLATAVSRLEVGLDAYEWRVLTEQWGPVATAAVVAWLEGWTGPPADLARLAEDPEAFVAGLEEALGQVTAPAAAVRQRLADWSGLGVDAWIDLLLSAGNVPAGTPLAVLARLDRSGIRQALRRDWPRLAGQAGIPGAVADELRVRGLGF